MAQEALLLAQLNHDNVLAFRAWCASPPCLITEFCERGSLRDVLAGALRGGAASLSWERRLRMARGAALGMAYLHSRSPPIIHRDLKSPNLLVDDSWRVKVADFGLSGLQGAGELPADRLNPLWAAPEVLCGAPATAASDVFSFGVVLWELLTWELPWERELGGGGPQDSAAGGGGGGLRGLLPEVKARVREGRRPGIPSNRELPGGNPEWAGGFLCEFVMVDWAVSPLALSALAGTNIRSIRVQVCPPTQSCWSAAG
jgi:serine/threonine protein kinase